MKNLPLYQQILLVVGTIILAAVLILEASSWWWGSASKNSYREAKQLLASHGAREYQLMLTECSALISAGVRVTYYGKEIPKSLHLLSVNYLRANDYACEVNLHKLPGKGIGYFVKKGNQGGWELSWHNHSESWKDHEIQINP